MNFPIVLQTTTFFGNISKVLLVIHLDYRTFAFKKSVIDSAKLLSVQSCAVIYGVCYAYSNHGLCTEKDGGVSLLKY